MESNLEDIEIQKLFEEEPEHLIDEEITNLEIDENKIEEEISNLVIDDSKIDDEISNLEINESEIEDSVEDKNLNLEKEIEQKKLDTEAEELADDFLKIQDRQAQKQMQLDLLINMVKAIGFDVSSIKDICSITFDRDFLKQRSIQNKITAFIPELRKCYNSAYLTCLHANAELKQKNLGINTLRQIMKCNYLKMTPKKVSHGYDKATGKKLESRIYLVEKMIY